MNSRHDLFSFRQTQAIVQRMRLGLVGALFAFLLLGHAPLVRADTAKSPAALRTEALLAFCANGDPKAYGFLLPIVMPVAGALAGHLEATTPGDLAVGTFGNLWKRLCKDELAELRIMDMDVEKYLKAATRNRFADLWRKAHPAGAGRALSLEDVHEHDEALRSMDLDPEEMLESERRVAAATEYARQKTPPIYRAAAVMRQRDGMLNSAVADIFNSKPSTITSGLDAMRKRMESVLRLDEPITPELMKQRFGVTINGLSDVADVLGVDFDYDAIAPTTGLPPEIRQGRQASGTPLWSRGEPMTIGEAMKKAGGKLKFVANGDDYYGYSMQMTVPPGIVSKGQGILIDHPIALTPPDAGQRMLLAGARYVRTLASGEAVYDLEAYCLDEHLDAPTEGATYAYDQSAQNIVSPSVKAAVKSEGSFAQKGVCVWKAVAGEASAPGTCAGG